MDVSALPDKFTPRIDVSTILQFEGSACWVWCGEINRNGYGRVWINGKRVMVHRVVYELLVGPIEVGLVLDHRCRNRRCCNPKHLEPVTVRENTLRGEAVLFQGKQMYEQGELL